MLIPDDAVKRRTAVGATIVLSEVVQSGTAVQQQVCITG